MESFAMPIKTLPAPDFQIDAKKYHIMLSAILFTFSADQGVISWTVEWDQYNHTKATGTPNNAAVYIDLIDKAGGVIPGDQIVFHPRHTFCLKQEGAPPERHTRQNKSQQTISERC
jgi:hypothetical protein